MRDSLRAVELIIIRITLDYLRRGNLRGQYRDGADCAIIERDDVRDRANRSPPAAGVSMKRVYLLWWRSKLREFAYRL